MPRDAILILLITIDLIHLNLSRLSIILYQNQYGGCFFFLLHDDTRKILKVNVVRDQFNNYTLSIQKNSLTVKLFLLFN